MPGYVADKDALLKRLRRVEGQARGLQRMVEEERYCIEIVTQIAAARTALERVALQLLDDHVRSCIAAGGDERIDELVEAIERFTSMR
jgi:CsoR family transcriptional regulator, copper-sensing transcriptional repressor